MPSRQWSPEKGTDNLAPLAAEHTPNFFFSMAHGVAAQSASTFDKCWNSYQSRTNANHLKTATWRAPLRTDHLKQDPDKTAYEKNNNLPTRLRR